MAGVYNRLGQVTALLSDMPVHSRVKRRTKAGEAFPTPPSAVETAQRAADVAHHARIENEVEAAQQRWLAEQVKAG